METVKGVRAVKNNITGNEKSDEWYTPIDLVQTCYELLDIPYESRVMLPFDTEHSNFVKWGQKHKYHLIYNINDYLEKNYEYDVLVTNPPFSIKDLVIERVLQLGKPAALTLPSDAIGGVKRHTLFAKYGYPSIYVPKRRISYIDGSGLNRKSSYFHTIIMLLNVKHSSLMWEQ